jgi:hypothetical protein
MRGDGPIVPPGDARQKRSNPSIPPALGEEAEGPLPNAWPTGLRIMECLACDARFVSSGRHERLCASCRRRKP